MRSRTYYFFPCDLIFSLGPYGNKKSLTLNFRRCLSSRKRKLSELYFATVGFAGATDNTPEGERYRQKEAAFLDANDITKYALWSIIFSGSESLCKPGC